MSFSADQVVTIENVTIYQDDDPVLNDITFNIGKGEFVFLVGRTGSGKSSLLRTMYADLPLRRGAMEVAGYAISSLKTSEVPQLRRKLGIIFQDFQLLEDRSVGDNLMFVMRATGWTDRGKMKQRMTEVLMRVGLGSIASKMPHRLSGGEQQRVVIARALINEPQILIADEPTGNLDPQVSGGIFDLFMEINKSGTAVLMATHDHTLLEKNPGTRVIKCQEGRIFDSEVENFSLSDGSVY